MQPLQYKVYTKDNVFKHVLNEEVIISDCSFKEQLDGGQGSITINTKLDYNDNSVIYGDIIKILGTQEGIGDTWAEAEYVWSSADENWGMSTYVLYSGYVNNLIRKYTPKMRTISYECIGIASLLSEIYMSDLGNIKYTVTDTPENIAQAIISYINTHHNLFSIKNLGTYGSNISLEVEKDTCADVFNIMQKATGRHWHIDSEGGLTFGPLDQYATHYLTLEKDIEELIVEDDGYGLANTIISDDNGTISEKTDTASIALYGRREKVVSVYGVGDTQTRDTYLQEELDDKKSVKQRISLIVNPEYKQKINPGDIINIRNIEKYLRGLQVMKISRARESIILDIEKEENYTEYVQQHLSPTV